MDSVGLIYNRALVPEPPQDFAELVRIAKGLTDPDQDQWGLALPLLSPYHVYPFMDAYGGYLFGCSSGVCDVTDLGIANEGSVRGIQFVSDLYLKEELFPEEMADRAVMHDYVVERFVEGRAALLIEGPWVLDRVRQGGIDYGVMAIPTLPEASGPARSLMVAQVLYVSSYSAHPAESLDLLNYIAGEGIVPLQSAVGGIPVRRDALRADAFRQDRDMRVWRDLAVAGVALPNVPEMGYVWQPWRYALDKAIPGLDSVEASLTEAAGAIDEALGADQ
jgi:arabinogalactan oligomer/maltooligosaccharide transport system substrate-binding protein